MKRALLISILLSVALLTQPALPGDGAQGKKVHDANCVGCHNTSVYTRRDRQIKSLAALNEQIAACSHAGRITLTDDEQESVVRYLNEQFYKFK
jgi:mono/diheme cytochrome c family protein